MLKTSNINSKKFNLEISFAHFFKILVWFGLVRFHQTEPKPNRAHCCRSLQKWSNTFRDIGNKLKKLQKMDKKRSRRRRIHKVMLPKNAILVTTYSQSIERPTTKMIEILLSDLNVTMQRVCCWRHITLQGAINWWKIRIHRVMLPKNS